MKYKNLDDFGIFSYGDCYICKKQFYITKQNISLKYLSLYETMLLFVILNVNLIISRYVFLF